MNFLELCKATRREAGLSGDGPSSVNGQYGMMEKVVEWVRQAHNDIQLSEHQWRFDWAQATFPLNEGMAVYDPVDYGLDVRVWKRDSARIEDAGGRVLSYLRFVPQEEIDAMSDAASGGIPVYVSELGNRMIQFHPVPVGGLVARMEYFRRPQKLVGNLDEPRMPEHYHMAIVWKAVMYCCSDIEDVQRFSAAQRYYNDIMMKMRVTELPPMDAPEAIA